jgi:hypothetical protein
MIFSLNSIKSSLFSLFVGGIIYGVQMPVNAQTITREQLDSMSIQDVIIFRNEQRRQARIVVSNCYNSPYIARSTCDIQYSQYSSLIANLNTYIAQRRAIGR